MQPHVVTVSVQGRAGLPESVLTRLEHVASVTHLCRRRTLTAEEACALFLDADVVAVTPKVMPAVDAALLRRLPRLRGLCVYATGTDMLDLDLLARHGVRLASVPGYCTQSVAEHALGLVLTLSRRIHLGNDRSRGLAPADVSLRGFELSGRTLGVVGLGRIGSRVAGLAQAFGMEVLAYDPAPRTAPGVRTVERETLWRTSDVVALTCSTTLGSPPVVTGTELAWMPAGGLLVNPSRASLVDHAAVVRAVRGGRLRGYAVDDAVLGPADADLVAEGRIVQTGHSAWWSDEALERGARLWGESMLAMVDSLAPVYSPVPGEVPA